MDIIKRLRERGQRGATLVEFALVFPLLLLLLFGVIEFSVILYDNAVVTNASREAAREWIEYNPTKLTKAQLDAVVQEYTENRLISFGSTSPSPTVTYWRATKIDLSDIQDITSNVTDYDEEDLLRVNVSYQYDYLFLPAMVSGIVPTLNLTAETVMRTEGVAP